MRHFVILPFCAAVVAGCTSPSLQPSGQDSAQASQHSSDAVAPAVAVALATPVVASGAVMSVAGQASTASGEALLDTGADILFAQPVPVRAADPAPRLN